MPNLPLDVQVQLNARKNLTVDFDNRGASRIVAFAVGRLKVFSIPRIILESNDKPQDAFVPTVVKDLSRTGIGIYFCEQMYPLQSFEVEFQGRIISASVVRCQYINSQCYEIGAIIENVRASRE
jgi:hypothetical protein